MSAAMDTGYSRARKQQAVLARAFDAVCEELGIGLGSLDVWRRERVGELLATLADAEDFDWRILSAKVVDAFPREDPQRSSG